MNSIKYLIMKSIKISAHKTGESNLTNVHFNKYPSVLSQAKQTSKRIIESMLNDSKWHAISSLERERERCVLFFSN